MSSIHRIWPRYSVSPICAAIIPNMRAPTPESPPWSRSPSIASASSMITTTGPIERSTPSTRSRLPSVSPTYLLRKFLSTTAGMPIEPATQVARKLLPVPTGPQNR